MLRTTLENAAGTQSVNSAGAAVKAQWDTAREDGLGAWSGGTSGDLTIPTTGVYLVTVCPAWQEGTMSGLVAYHLQQDPLGVGANGVILSACHHPTTVYNACMPFSWAGTLFATDKISVWIYHEQGSARHWGGYNRPGTGASHNCEITLVQLAIG